MSSFARCVMCTKLCVDQPKISPKAWVCPYCAYKNAGYDASSKSTSGAALKYKDWQCPQCTLNNKGVSSKCSVCGEKRPKSAAVKKTTKKDKSQENKATEIDSKKKTASISKESKSAKQKKKKSGPKYVTCGCPTTWLTASCCVAVGKLLTDECFRQVKVGDAKSLREIYPKLRWNRRVCAAWASATPGIARIASEFCKQWAPLADSSELKKATARVSVGFAQSWTQHVLQLLGHTVDPGAFGLSKLSAKKYGNPLSISHCGDSADAGKSSISDGVPRFALSTYTYYMLPARAAQRSCPMGCGESKGDGGSTDGNAVFEMSAGWAKQLAGARESCHPLLMYVALCLALKQFSCGLCGIPDIKVVESGSELFPSQTCRHSYCIECTSNYVSDLYESVFKHTENRDVDERVAELRIPAILPCPVEQCTPYRYLPCGVMTPFSNSLVKRIIGSKKDIETAWLVVSQAIEYCYNHRIVYCPNSKCSRSLPSGGTSLEWNQGTGMPVVQVAKALQRMAGEGKRVQSDGSDDIPAPNKAFVVNQGRPFPHYPPCVDVICERFTSTPKFRIDAKHGIPVPQAGFQNGFKGAYQRLCMTCNSQFCVLCGCIPFHDKDTCLFAFLDVMAAASSGSESGALASAVEFSEDTKVDCGIPRCVFCSVVLDSQEGISWFQEESGRGGASIRLFAEKLAKLPGALGQEACLQMANEWYRLGKAAVPICKAPTVQLTDAPRGLLAAHTCSSCYAAFCMMKNDAPSACGWVLGCGHPCAGTRDMCLGAHEHSGLVVPHLPCIRCPPQLESKVAPVNLTVSKPVSLRMRFLSFFQCQRAHFRIADEKSTELEQQNEANESTEKNNSEKSSSPKESEESEVPENPVETEPKPKTDPSEEESKSNVPSDPTVLVLKVECPAAGAPCSACKLSTLSSQPLDLSFRAMDVTELERRDLDLAGMVRRHSNDGKKRKVLKAVPAKTFIVRFLHSGCCSKDSNGAALLDIARDYFLNKGGIYIDEA